MRSSLWLAVPLALLARSPAQSFQPVPGAAPSAGTEGLCYDAGRDRVVAFVGTATWEHDGFAWKQVATTLAPPGRYEYAMVHDGKRVLLHGGQAAGGSNALDDFWAFDGAAWTKLSTSNGPGRRRGHAMAFDSVRKRVVLHGGTDMLGGFPADTWEWDGTSWTQVTNSGPGSRVWHRMVYDEGRGRVVMCGGAMNPMLFTDTWEWDGASWFQTVFTGFPVRLNPAMVFDAATQRTLVIGGFTGGGSSSDVLVYEPATTTWSTRQPIGAPTLGQVVGAAYDRGRERTLVLSSDLFAPTEAWYYRDAGTLAATYVPFGSGCLGGLGQIPLLLAAPGAVPGIGVPFRAEVSSVGNATSVVLWTGVSRRTWLGLPLPLPLATLGLPGCELLVAYDAPVVLPVQASTKRAVWSVNMPNVPSLRSLVFYQQALTLDPSASNGIGGVSNGCMGSIQ